MQYDRNVTCENVQLPFIVGPGLKTIVGCTSAPARPAHSKPTSMLRCKQKNTTEQQPNEFNTSCQPQATRHCNLVLCTYLLSPQNASSPNRAITQLVSSRESPLTQPLGGHLSTPCVQSHPDLGCPGAAMAARHSTAAWALSWPVCTPVHLPHTCRPQV